MCIQFVVLNFCAFIFYVESKQKTKEQAVCAPTA